VIIQVCGTCHKKMSFAPDKAGAKMSCPTCGDPFVVGQAAEESEEEDAYGLAGAPKAKKPAPRSAGKSSANLKKVIEEPELPEGKVECPTCFEAVNADADTCPYCGDLIRRGGGKRRR
jgi:rRNA maturation endonuclease Nob1